MKIRRFNENNSEEYKFTKRDLEKAYNDGQYLDGCKK